MALTESQTRVVEAIGLLFKGDPSLIKQADDYLKGWQRSVGAWDDATAILHTSGLEQEVLYVAAQSIRTKIQYDFHELRTSEALFNIRNVLFSLLSNMVGSSDFGKLKLVAVQLALAIADIAVQAYPTWKDTVKDVCQILPQTENGTFMTVTVLQLLAEESFNLKILVENDVRMASREELARNSEAVIQFLMQCVQSQPDRVRVKAMECFSAWLRFGDSSGATIEKCPLFAEAFVQLKSDDLGEVATDIIERTLRLRLDDLTHTIHLRLTSDEFRSLIFARLEDVDDTEGAMRFARCIGQLADSVPTNGFCEGLVNGSASCQTLVEYLLRALRYPDVNVADLVLDFWFEFASFLRSGGLDGPGTPMSELHPLLVKVAEEGFKGILDAFDFSRQTNFQDFSVPPHEDICEKEDVDFGRFRVQLIDLANSYKHILGQKLVLEIVLPLLGSLIASKGNPLTIEALVFLLSSIGLKENLQEFPGFVELLRSLPSVLVQPCPQKFSYLYCRLSYIVFLGRSSGWLTQDPALLMSVFKCLTSFLTAQVDPSTSAPLNPGMQKVLSTAFRELCFESKHAMYRLHSEAIAGQLVDLLAQSAPLLKVESHLKVCEGVGTFLSAMPKTEAGNEAFKANLMRAVSIFADPCLTPGQSLSAKDFGELCDRVCFVIRYQGAHDEFIPEVFGQKIWPMVQAGLSQHPSSPALAEKVCRVIKHSLRCMGGNLFKQFAPGWGQVVAQGFEATCFSSYMYATEVLLEEYKEDADLRGAILDLYFKLSRICLSKVDMRQAQADPGLFEELLEDFFGMSCRCLRHCPQEVVGSQEFKNQLEMAVTGVNVLKSKHALESLFSFFEQSLDLALWVREAPGDIPYSDQVRQTLEPLMMQASPHLMRALVLLMVSAPPSFVDDYIPHVLRNLRDFGPNEYGSWLEQALQAMPTAVLGENERPKAVKDLTDIHHFNNFRSRFGDLMRKCRQLQMRNTESIRGN